MKRILILFALTLTLVGCTETKLFWNVDEGVNRASDKTAAASSKALEVPPDLKGEVEAPMPEQIAAGEVEKGERIAPVAGKAVSLDTRVYDVDAATVFSAVVDAMTSLNLPVASVDSPSGTITTEWIRENANTPNAVVSAFSSLFGGGPRATRYRFIVRVLRLKSGKGSQLQIRTLGQAFINRHWVNRPIKRKVANELFAAVEEQLGRVAPSAPERD